MNSLNYFIFARVLHVLGVVLWIGGVAFVTTVLIPALKEIPSGEKRLEQFERLERRFANQARVVTVITGLSGFYLLYAMDAWERYHSAEYWWVHLMTAIWTIFTLVLFILEPLVLHRFFADLVRKDSEKAFVWLQRMHRVLLSLSVLAIAGGVAGAHGLNFRGLS